MLLFFVVTGRRHQGGRRGRGNPALVHEPNLELPLHYGRSGCAGRFHQPRTGGERPRQGVSAGRFGVSHLNQKKPVFVLPRFSIFPFGGQRFVELGHAQCPGDGAVYYSSSFPRRLFRRPKQWRRQGDVVRVWRGQRINLG